jgi:hypothetical protein
VSELASHPDMLVVIRRMIGDHADIGEALEAAGGPQVVRTRAPAVRAAGCEAAGLAPRDAGEPARPKFQSVAKLAGAAYASGR